MLISVFGTPTPYAFWGFTVVRHVMDVLYGNHHHIHCLNIEDLRKGFAARNGKPVVFTSDCPDSEIGDLFLNFGAPIIVFLDDFEDTVVFAMESRGMDAPQAIRFSVHCFCSLEAIILAPTTTCFTHRHYDDDVRDLIVILFKIIAGPPSKEQVDQAMRLLINDYQSDDFMTLRQQVIQLVDKIERPVLKFESFADDVKTLIAEVAKAYLPIIERKPLLNVTWPRGVFLGDFENYTVPEIIDFIGPARIFIWGPYLFLPEGTWTVTVKFEVSQCLSGNRIAIDILINTTEIATLVEFDLPVEGSYSFDIKFQHKDRNWPIEVRFFLKKGAIEGKFYLSSISLRRTEANVELRPSTNIKYMPN